MITFFILHMSISLMLFICMFLYANLTDFAEADLNKDWNLIKNKFKNRLKQDYILKKESDYILIRLKFLDNRFIKNSIQVESTSEEDSCIKLKLSGRTDLKPFGFMFFLLLTFVFYIGAVYMYIIIKNARKRAQREMEFIANLSINM
jgi:hypothetical protein